MSEPAPSGAAGPTAMNRLDRQFERLVPDPLRPLAAQSWTPAHFALRAVALLAPRPGLRVLDVGAGAGKLCAIGALAGACTWVGVERRAELVDAARSLFGLLGVSEHAIMRHGDAFELDWSEYDSLYFYNPFDPSDATRRAPTEVALACARLARLPEGTRVVTLDGYGGPMPSGFELLYHERDAVTGRALAAWRKQRAP